MPLKKELEDMSRAGYEGVSIMSYHVGIFEQIRSVWGTLDYFLEELKERKLEWARLYWYGKSLTDYKEQRYVIDELKMLSELAGYCKCENLVVDVLHQGVTFDYPITDEKIKIFADCLSKAGKETLENGVKTSIHPHLNGLIETREHLDKFMEYSDPRYVWLDPDSAQAYLAGFNAADAVRKYKDRIACADIKDAKSKFEKVDKRQWVHGKGWPLAKSKDDLFVWELDRRYVDLGHGEVDLKDYVRALKEINFNGWLIVEDDGEGCINPLQSYINNRKYINDVLLPATSK